MRLKDFETYRLREHLPENINFLVEVWLRFAGKWATSVEGRFSGRIWIGPSGRWRTGLKLLYSARQLRKLKAL